MGGMDGGHSFPLREKALFFWFCTKFVCMLNKSNLILGTPVARLPYEEKSQKKKKKLLYLQGKRGRDSFLFNPLFHPLQAAQVQDHRP